jgi:hypothetical protein
MYILIRIKILPFVLDNRKREMNFSCIDCPYITLGLLGIQKNISDINNNLITLLKVEFTLEKRMNYLVMVLSCVGN